MNTIKYLTMAVAALMMAACSNDELESAASKSGGRRALEIVPIVQGQTRAAQLTTSTLSTFYVSVTGKFCEEDGTEITNPVLTLTKNGSNWGYTYLVGSDTHNGPLYWPNEAATATFSAYTHAAGAVNEATGQTDIIGGWATKDFDGSTDPGQVGLTLQHAVAKMQFKALVSGAITIDIKQVAVRNIGYAGTYAIPTSATDNKGVLTLSTSASPATEDIVSVSASKGTFIGGGASTATDLASLFMVPQTITAQDLSAATWSNSYISILAQVRMTQGSTESMIFPGNGAVTTTNEGKYAWIALPMPTAFTGMEAHKKYIFTLNFDATHGAGKVDRDQDPDDTDTDPATDPDDNIDPNDKGKDIKLPGSSNSRVIVTVTEVNDFDEGGDIDVINTSSGGGSSASVPEGALPGAFSVSATEKVYFSKGNLQLVGANTWKFADHQWDYFGASQSNNHRDLFGWGTKDNPNNTNTTNANYSWNEWGENTDLVSALGADWRTLTFDQWYYLLNQRTTCGTVFGTSGASYTQAIINTDGTSVKGMILFPDGVNIASNEVATTSSVNHAHEWIYATQCTIAQWAALESKGCVFLPSAGCRLNGTTVMYVGDDGHYWSSSPEGSNKAYNLFFQDGNAAFTYSDRSMGNSVRLVYDVE